MKAAVQGDSHATTAAVALQNKMAVGGTLAPFCCGKQKLAEKALKNQAGFEVESHVEQVRSCRVKDQGSDSDEVT